MFLLVDAWQGTVYSPLEQSIAAWNISTKGRHQRWDNKAKSSEGEDTMVHTKQ